MKHFQFLIVEVCQYSVCVVDFNAYRKMLIDVVQELFALSQHLCGGRHIRTVLYFGYAVNLGLSVFIGFCIQILLRTHVGPLTVSSR